MDGFPWAVLVVNVAGSVAIGVLLVLVVEVMPSPHRLLRPFMGTGVLGGFTTMSTHADQVWLLL
ncbi:MAG TPA: CrcB family protein [Dermatophilaceae bacterium]|nr:CrcB family protein [Dermatophilaceae bacterium]